MVLFRLLMLLLSLVLLLPVIAPVLAVGVAGALDCRLDEAGVYPCLMGDRDLGPLLATLFVSGWFGLLTLPLLVIVLAIWATAEIGIGAARRRARRQAGSEDHNG